MEPFSTLPADVSRVLIVGAGVAGNAAAEMLRRRGFTGTISMIGADAAGPYDRPNLSKDYLAGTAQEDWLPLHSSSFYKRHEIELLTSTRVKSIDVSARKATLENGEVRDYDRLLLCTGADPIALKVPGAEQKHVFYLRTLADTHAIIAATSRREARRRHRRELHRPRGRGIAAHARARRHRRRAGHRAISEGVRRTARHAHQVAARGARREIRAREIRDGHRRNGRHARRWHEAPRRHRRHWHRRAAESRSREADGAHGRQRRRRQRISSSRARRAIYAAGDIAAFPYRTGERIRVEHFVVAERQGQFAAENMLGARKKYDDIPFFWSVHFGTEIRYVGHASKADDIAVGGDIEKGDALVAYREKGRPVAFASLGRDLACLMAEHALETDDAKTMTELTSQ